MLPWWPDVIIVQSDITIVVPWQLSTGSIHDYLFCYCPLVSILFEFLRITLLWCHNMIQCCNNPCLCVSSHLVKGMNTMDNVFVIMASYYYEISWFVVNIPFFPHYITFWILWRQSVFTRMVSDNPWCSLWVPSSQSWTSKITIIFSCLHIHQQTCLTEPDFQKRFFEI